MPSSRPARPPSAPTRRSASLARQTRPERLLTASVLALVLFGLVMVYSSSSTTALLSEGNSTGLLWRQVAYAAIGFGAYLAFSRISLVTLAKLGPVLVAVSGVLLVLVLVPGVGVSAKGSARWLALGSFAQVQPSEIAKFAVVLWLAQAIARDPARITTPRGLVPYLGVAAALSLLILVEPDLGTAATLMIVTLGLLAAAGARMRHLGALVGAGLVLGMLAIAVAPYRRDRLTSFLDPWSDPEGSGFQAVQAQLAVASGGIDGVGLGGGLQKAFYLPEAHTDMILATVGEELGVLGILGVLIALGLVILAGYRIAISAPDRHQRLLAAGLTTLIAVQGIVNAGAVLGATPITGVPFPYVSFGGNSLVVLLASAGILVNIGRRGAQGRPRLTLVNEGRDRRRGHGGSRHTGAGGRRRARGAGG
jgi:cell division protein FtsW